MSNDPIIKYATGYVKGKMSIVSLEREAKYTWWVRIKSLPYDYECHIYTFERSAKRRFWNYVDIYGLKVIQFEPFDIDKEQILNDLLKKEA